MESELTFTIEPDEVDIFLQDVNEHLQAMEGGVLRLEQAREGDPDTLNAVFRAAHTLKAVASTIGHHHMADLTHTLETLFDRMREGELAPTQAVTDELLAALDALKALRDEVVSLQPSPIDVDALLDRLRGLMDVAARPAGQPAGQPGGRPTEEQAAEVRRYREEGLAVLEIEVVADPEAFAPAARLMQASMALAEVGQIVAQHPSQCDLLYEQGADRLWLLLATRADGGAVEELLGDVSALSEFGVRPYGAPEAAPDASAAPSEDEEDHSPGPAGPVPQAESRSKSVRISVERLDTLMNLVGELVTDRTRLVQIGELLRTQRSEGEIRAHRGNGTFGALNDMTTHFSRVVDQLQQEVMQARMLPIAHLFDRFPRLVRDLARNGGKQVELIVAGEATELDRSVIEVIGDPLIHLLRNAVDHGIETPEEREGAGKPPAGSVWLSAAHQEGHIVITVRDDGRGIDPARIRRAAVSCGLLAEEEVARLDDDAVISLIFEPTLSTADAVTDVSGRGVGLDVVRTNVKRLSGSVVVESEVGWGTTFRLTLPLTLAIVQAMLVAHGEDVYAIPLTSIVESLYFSDVAVSSVLSKPIIRWRDSVLPLLPLRRIFAHRRLAPPSDGGGQQAVVTVAWGRQQVGLVVDRLIGKQEIVIKSLGSFIGSVPGISGCAVLGDGSIALIVDVPGLIGAVMQAQTGKVGLQWTNNTHSGPA